jgi:hypothetical protein
MDEKSERGEFVLIERRLKSSKKFRSILGVATLALLSVLAAAVLWRPVAPFASTRSQDGPVGWGNCGRGSGPYTECGDITYVSEIAPL